MNLLKLKSLLLCPCLAFIFSCTADKNTRNKSLPQNEMGIKKEQPQLADEKGEIRNMQGTVVFQELEGGFWGIIADDGRKFNPVNLQDQFKKDSLRVTFDANAKKGMVGIHMWGEYVEILKMKKSEDE